MEDPQQTHPDFTPEDLEPRPFKAPPRHRVLWTLAILAVIALLAVLPPLVHVNRYQHQINTSIAQSLGRPVHTGEVTLNLLPFPGFTIQNFVVAEDPAFGSEPVIRATSVMARLRWRSLWQRHIEFSRITLQDASVNLVRRADGQWNVESILLQASRMPAAPTAQRGPGDRPRFPYIEATGARINFKMGLEKLPVSLTEADFALWLPEAEQWRLRLEAHPARTDASVTDTGLLRLEGTLGRATRLADVPVDLHASWTSAPLGAASVVLSGRDMGFRGELTLNAAIKGTAGNNAFQSRLQLDRVRRADFVPTQLLDADITCTARALGNLHRLEDLHCAWPTGSSNSGLVVTGEVPDTLAPANANLQINVLALPAASLLQAARLLTPRISPDVTVAGIANAHFTCCQPDNLLTGGNFTVTQAQFTAGSATPFLTGDINGTVTEAGVQVELIPLDFGGPKPVQFHLAFDTTHYNLGLEGPATPERLAAFATALPLLSDGLPEVTPASSPTIELNRISNGSWGEPQSWDAPEFVMVTPNSKKHR